MRHTLTALLCSLALSNCAREKDFIPMPPHLPQHVSSTRVYLEEPQDKMNADVRASNLQQAAGGGLLFALIDAAIVSHRESCAEDAMEDLQKELKKINLSQHLLLKLSRSLEQAAWLHAEKPVTMPSWAQDDRRDVLEKASADCVLESKLVYKLSHQLDILTGTLFVTLYPTSERMKKLANPENPNNHPLLKFHISAAQSLPHRGKDMEENARLWAQKEGIYLREALEKLLEQLMVGLDQTLANPDKIVER